MAKKDTFLLVSLQEDKAKELAQIITNRTCRRILDYLAENVEATESRIADDLSIALSTVHYNLEQLRKAKLVDTDEFHYSVKGKEVAHYKLASKYIIIAPKSTWGLKEKLKNVLPLAAITAGAAFLLKIFSSGQGTLMNKALEAAPLAAESYDAAAPAVLKTSDIIAAPGLLESTWIWFVAGAVFAVVLYLAIDYLRKRK